MLTTVFFKVCNCDRIKEHKIDNNDIVLVFHKDYTYHFNEATKDPIQIFKLTNCKNIFAIEFEHIDDNNDGVIIEVENKNELAIFTAADMSGHETKIFCDNVTKEDLKYRESDLVDIIKSIEKETSNYNDLVVGLNDKIERLTNSLIHDLDIINRKLTQANWLTSDKKQFLEGQKNAIQNLLLLIDK